MKAIFLLLFSICSFTVLAQEGITFKVQECSMPYDFLEVQTSDDIYKDLITIEYESKAYSDSLKENIISKNHIADSLVNYGYHSFFEGLYNAYSDHRPFVLSPDVIWLLICQGFSKHIELNANELQYHFTNSGKKVTLSVTAENIPSLNLKTPEEWEKVFPMFTEQVSKHIGTELTETLTADFSTTTPTEKIASQITLMKSMQPFFSYILKSPKCGIPEITLTGTTKDWKNLLKKTQYLAKYDLEWWVKDLEPILKEFIKTSKGKIDKDFWINIMQDHSVTHGCYTLNYFSGWIINFFPYNHKGERIYGGLKKGEKLPNEIVKVNVDYIKEGEEATSEPVKLEFWAGITGLSQNNEDYTLTPEIGWMVRKKEEKSAPNKQLARYFRRKQRSDFPSIKIRVDRIPEEVYSFKKISTLEIKFTGSIVIPDRLAEIDIRWLKLSGRVNDSEIERIKKLFPDINVDIYKYTNDRK